MLKALTRAGLGRVESEVELITYAAAYGFDAVELDPCQLHKECGLDQAKQLLDEKNIVAAAFSLAVNWQDSEKAFQEDLQQLPHRAYAASMLGSTVCCTYILPSTDLDLVTFSFHAVRRLRICAQILQPYGIKLAIEFVGPHHLRTAWKYPFIHTMEDTLFLIDAIALPNVGLLIDSYHWHCNNMNTTQLKLLNAQDIAYVHINDAKPLPIEQLVDNDRLYPGDGVIDLVAFLEAIHSTGYQGIVAQEILSTESNIINEQALTTIQSGMNSIWSQLRLSHTRQ
ncbi:sugar phosphate isomerase/epimerase family protein [Paenibacillus endoradicis]|uniref:sugar phosphate isomerase/epimerase family protein n=1 Tax=Paenibacillus endoradicis TaxID=2972487 RepID=UPI00215953E6|nr:sugar phosphate isomerase/epimerase family protein [Paenibacillus endoradicis]MCR8659937.1 sugar phosphate isomerase/epimerase [Paenibacillus endoradicis]